MSKYLRNIIIENFSGNHVKGNILLIDWIVGIINEILKHPLDTPEWRVKRYRISITCRKVPPPHTISRKKLTQILSISLKEYLNQLVQIFIPRSDVLE